MLKVFRGKTIHCFEAFGFFRRIDSRSQLRELGDGLSSDQKAIL